MLVVTAVYSMYVYNECNALNECGAMLGISISMLFSYGTLERIKVEANLFLVEATNEATIRNDEIACNMTC
jgi:uncharacterized membrane protein YiaA